MSYYHQPETVRTLAEANSALDRKFPDRREIKEPEEVEGGLVSILAMTVTTIVIVGGGYLILALPL